MTHAVFGNFSILNNVLDLSCGLEALSSQRG
jgi:hypothetical protein